MFLYEILNFLSKKVASKNIYVVPVDMLPSKFSLPAGFVVNLSPSNYEGKLKIQYKFDQK